MKINYATTNTIKVNVYNRTVVLCTSPLTERGRDTPFAMKSK